jgi:hypothetical protein
VLDLQDREIVASNGRLHPFIMRLIEDNR